MIYKISDLRFSSFQKTPSLDVQKTGQTHQRPGESSSSEILEICGRRPWRYHSQRRFGFMDHKIKNTKFHESLLITGDLVGDNLDLLLSGHVLVTHFGIALHTVNPGIQLESEEIRT